MGSALFALVAVPILLMSWALASVAFFSLVGTFFVVQRAVALVGDVVARLGRMLFGEGSSGA